MKLSIREKIMVCLLVWALGIYLFFNYVYSPLKHEASDWEEKNILLREQLISARQIDKSFKALDDKKQQRSQDRYTTVARQVPSMEYIPEIVAFIEDSSNESGLELLLLNYRKEGAGEDRLKNQNNKSSPSVSGVKNLNFNLTGRGSYYDTVTFIESLEKAARIYSISEIALSAEERKIAAPAGVSEGEVSDPPASVLKGASRFDPNNITLNMKIRTYCDGKALPGIKDIDNPVAPVSSQSDNPFLP